MADSILKYLAKQPIKHYDIDDIQQNALPGIDTKTIDTILIFIATYPELPTLIHYTDQYAITTNNISSFLKDGGFTAIYDAMEAKTHLQDEYENILQHKTITDLRLAEKKIKDYVITKWMARIAFLLSVILSIIEIKRKLF